MDFIFKELDEPVFSSDPAYDLLYGGYIKPQELLEDQEQAKKVREAVEVVYNFLAKAEEVGILEES